MDIYNKINQPKADKYLQLLLPSLENENEQLKNQRISSVKFKEEQKKLYNKYGIMISQVFSKGRYKSWSSCTQGLERYHILSETKFIPREKINTLYKTESEWKKKRDHILEGNDEEYIKIEKTQNILTTLNSQIRQIIGTEIGNWYINYKDMTFRTLENMDKYGATYNESWQISQIEVNCSTQRAKIWEERPKNRNEKLQEIENYKLSAIKKAVPPQVAKKWIAINNSQLDYVLAKRYGLNKVQINQFKNAYNIYAIEEYKIINEQKKLSTADKAEKLKVANETFLQSVRPLFSNSSYKKWRGKRMYDLNKKKEYKR